MMFEHIFSTLERVARKMFAPLMLQKPTAKKLRTPTPDVATIVPVGPTCKAVTIDGVKQYEYTGRTGRILWGAFKGAMFHEIRPISDTYKDLYAEAVNNVGTDLFGVVFCGKRNTKKFVVMHRSWIRW